MGLDNSSQNEYFELRFLWVVVFPQDWLGIEFEQNRRSCLKMASLRHEGSRLVGQGQKVFGQTVRRTVSQGEEVFWQAFHRSVGKGKEDFFFI